MGKGVEGTLMSLQMRQELGWEANTLEEREKFLKVLNRLDYWKNVI